MGNTASKVPTHDNVGSANVTGIDGDKTVINDSTVEDEHTPPPSHIVFRLASWAAALVAAVLVTLGPVVLKLLSPPSPISFSQDPDASISSGLDGSAAATPAATPAVLTAAPQGPSLDSSSFPHIFDKILSLLDGPELLVLRGTCRGLRAMVDILLERHLVFKLASTSNAIVIYPYALEAMVSDPKHRWLQNHSAWVGLSGHTRTLDLWDDAHLSLSHWHMQAFLNLQTLRVRYTDGYVDLPIYNANYSRFTARTLVIFSAPDGFRNLPPAAAWWPKGTEKIVFVAKESRWMNRYPSMEDYGGPFIKATSCPPCPTLRQVVLIADLPGGKEPPLSTSHLLNLIFRFLTPLCVDFMFVDIAHLWTESSDWSGFTNKGRRVIIHPLAYDWCTDWFADWAKDNSRSIEKAKGKHRHMASQQTTVPAAPLKVKFETLRGYAIAFGEATVRHEIGAVDSRHEFESSYTHIPASWGVGGA